MNKFIGKFSFDIHLIEFALLSHILERLQDQVCELKLPNEDELLIQISGLKQVRTGFSNHSRSYLLFVQIANVLNGKLTFDGDSLQTLLNYKPKENPIKANDNNPSELS